MKKLVFLLTLMHATLSFSSHLHDLIEGGNAWRISQHLDDVPAADFPEYVNELNENGDTPLHIAIQNGRLEIVQILIRHGVDFNAVTRNNCTPLFLANTLGQLDIVQYLLEVGASSEPIRKRKRNDIQEEHKTHRSNRDEPHNNPSKGRFHLIFI